MSDRMKTVIAICVTSVLIAVIAAITSVTVIQHGDAGMLVRNLGLVAAFLVVNVPILLNSLRAKESAERTEQVSQHLVETTEAIQHQVNGKMTQTIKDAVHEAVNGGQETDGALRSEEV